MRSIDHGLQGYDSKMDKVVSAAGGLVGGVIDRAGNAASICNQLSVEYPEMRAHSSEIFKCQFHPSSYAEKHGYVIAA